MGLSQQTWNMHSQGKCKTSVSKSEYCLGTILRSVCRIRCPGIHFFCCYCLFLINVQCWMYPPKPNRAPSKASSIVTDNYTVPLSLSMLFKWSQNPKCLLAGLHVMLKKKKKRIIAAILRSWLALVPTVFKPCDQKKQIWHELGQRLHQQLLFYLSRMASAWVWGKTLGRLRKIEPHYHSGLRECAGSFAAVKMHSPV